MIRGADEDMPEDPEGVPGYWGMVNPIIEGTMKKLKEWILVGK